AADPAVDPAGGEPAVREASPTPDGGPGRPERRTLGPIGDPVDPAPLEAAPAADDQPAVRRVGPKRRQG
ncbi:MAG: hypothetical protein M3350_09760, partial [Actinomycetota bacterium]|nr:hypothetical protein [Actinomycetota bacterium]